MLCLTRQAEQNAHHFGFNSMGGIAASQLIELGSTIQSSSANGGLRFTCVTIRSINAVKSAV